MDTESKGRTGNEKRKEIVKTTNSRNIRSHEDEWFERTDEQRESSDSQNVPEFQKFSSVRE